MTAFLAARPTLDANWRAVVLFGRNVASYKFALAKALLGMAGRADDRVPLEELAARHCQAVEAIAAADRAARWDGGSRCHADARLLAPDPEGPGAGAPVPGGGHQVPPRAEMGPSRTWGVLCPGPGDLGRGRDAVADGAGSGRGRR